MKTISESVATEDCRNQDNSAPTNQIRKTIQFRKTFSNLAFTKIKRKSAKMQILLANTVLEQLS